MLLSEHGRSRSTHEHALGSYDGMHALGAYCKHVLGPYCKHVLGLYCKHVLGPYDGMHPPGLHALGSYNHMMHGMHSLGSNDGMHALGACDGKQPLCSFGYARKEK